MQGNVLACLKISLLVFVCMYKTRLVLYYPLDVIYVCAIFKSACINAIAFRPVEVHSIVKK